VPFKFLLVFVIFYCCAGWGYIVAFTKVLIIYQTYHTWTHPLHHSLLFPSPISGTVPTSIIFLFTYTCTQYLHHIHPPTLFPHITLPLVPTSLHHRRQYMFCSPILWFCKRKKWHFDTYAVSFPVALPCIYDYNTNRFIPSIFLLSSLVPFLWWFQQV
jgi:hypothetical protein